MAYLDTPDTLIAQLTLEGRNILGRAKIGDVVYRKLGWHLGRGGYIEANPVKVSDIIDEATEAGGLLTIANNDNWNTGTYLELNGVRFIYGEHFTRGSTSALTVKNIQNAILDSKDLRHYRLIDPILLQNDTLQLKCLITGVIGNLYPMSVYNVSTTNLALAPMAGGISTFLEDPAWPLPAPDPLEPMLLPFSGTEGLIEMPASTAVSFLTRVGEDIGMGAYGELGIWVEIVKSTFVPEIGRKVLFAVTHFPIQPKTDRSIISFRVIVSF